jgi:hypothetical protein
MPNWVFNGLTAQGPHDSIAKMKAQLNTPYTRHYEDVWDMDTNTMGPKDVTYSNPVFSFWNIIKPTDLDAYTKQRDHSKDVYDNSGDDWYSWNNRNWGTKWDVAVSNDSKHPETYMEETQDEWTASVYYNFNTAWGVADKALTNLSSQYPDILFTLSFEEETGWGGEWELLRGEIISESEYESKCPDCEAYDILEYCAICENNVCSACNFGAEEVCETHKEKMEA